MWHNFDQVPAELGPTVVVIGNFDGVHRGHQAVIEAAKQAGAAAHQLVVAVTFDPHPMAVLRPDYAPQMLTDITTRAALLRQAGADEILAIPFSIEISQWTPHEFIQRVLLETLQVQHVVVGSNFRFGHRAAGDLTLLQQVGSAAGFQVTGVALDGGPQVWSSTYVRTCLFEGDVTGAAEALGRPYAVAGSIVAGEKRGRQLGFPTANLHTELAIPGDGVYAGWLGQRSTGEQLPAAISIGTNPTFAGERQRRVEAYVLDRTDLDLYGSEVEVAFLRRVRPTLRFADAEELVATMHQDVEQTRSLLRGVPPPPMWHHY